MPKILVTGGAGFIGSHIVDELIGAGHQIAVIDDLSSGAAENLPEQVQLRVLDIRSSDARAFVTEFRPDIIVHTAAQISVRGSMANPDVDADVNIVGLLNILQGCAAALPYFVFLSTGGALYGEQDYFPAKEDHRIAPTSAYGLAKYVSELYLDLWRREFGLKAVALRLANVYGPRQNPHGEAGVVAIFNEILLSGKTAVIYGDGKQTRDFVYVGDVARAVALAVSKRVEGSFNIGTGVETDVNSLYGIIADFYEASGSPQYKPIRPGEQKRSCIDPIKAKQTLGWESKVAIREGLQKTCQWFREQRSKARSS